MLVRRLRARAVGTAVACVLAVSGLSLVVTAAPAQAANPIINGPAGGVTVAVVPNLSWQRVGAATSYDVQVANSVDFTTKLVDVNTANSSYTPIVNLPEGNLWWRVRVTGTGEAGWTTEQFVRDGLPRPTMLGPTGNLQQPDSPPLISWTPVPGATQYNLQVSTDGSFTDTTKITNYIPLKTTSGINPVLVGPGQYYARVRATLNGGLTTGFSDPITYTIVGLRAATRLSPAENGVVTDTVLDWAPVPGASKYQIQIDDDNNFASPVTDDSNVLGTRYSPPKTIGNDTYYWRVRPIDASGNARAWSPADRGTFQRAWPGQVHLEYPADSSTVGNPFYYQWSPSERTSSAQEDLALSSSYTLEVATSPTFQGTVMRCQTTLTTWVPQDGGSGDCWPQASGTYYWRVIGHDDFSSTRPATDQPSAEVRSFNYQPDAPTPTSPSNGAHVTVPTISWTAVPGASRYRVTITGPSTNIVDTTAATSYTPHDLLDPGTYSWQVSTVSLDNRIGTVYIFNQRSFVVDGPPTGVAGPPNPTSSPTSRRFPTLTWNPVLNATRYELWVKPHANIGYTLVDDDFSYPAGESLNGAYLVPGDYDWFVKALDTNSNLLSSGSIGTFTINPLEVIPDEQQYAALSGTLLPDDPEDPAADVTADSCPTQILHDDTQSACDSLRSTPVLRWAAKPNVGSYLLYVAHDQEMTNPVYDLNQDGIFTPIVLTQPMWTPDSSLPDSQAGTAYYYKVVPCSYTQCEKLSHAQHSFDKLSRPAILNPAQYTPVLGSAPVTCPADTVEPDKQGCADDVTLSWQDYRTTEKTPYLPTPATAERPFDVGTPLQSPGRTEARSYVIQTATDPSFNSLIESREVDQTTFTLYDTTYPEGLVYWRVRAVDASINQLAWSDTGVFIKRSPQPVLEQPTGAAPVRGDLFLQWAALPFASSYRVEVYKNHDTNANASNQAVVPGTVLSRAVSITNLLPQLPQMPNGDDPYVWRVRRIDAAGRTGAWSDWGHFRVVEPSATQTSPAADASVEPSDSTFTWQSVAGAESYRFERRVVGTTSIVEPVTTRALSWAPKLAIPGGSWEWRVTAIDAQGNDLTPSGWRQFTVVDAVTATTATIISGSGKVGTPLIVSSPPAWNFDPAVTTTYQWYRAAAPISGETGTSYTVTSADRTKTISVKATGSRPGYLSGTSTSNSILAISGNAPVAVDAVAITGSGKTGTPLVVTPPVWESDQVTTTYTWQRDGALIGGQTAATYTMQAADVGHQVTVTATGVRAGYDNGTSVSSPIAGVLGDAPSASTAVVISGASNKQGTKWTATAPTWNTTSVVTTYKWFRDADPITGATATTYTLAAADVGHTVTVQAIGTKAGYALGTSVSNEVVVAPLDPVVNTLAPTVTGNPAARETLTATTGTWAPASGVAYGYQWFIDDVAVAKATKNTYLVRTIDAGHQISVRVTATASGFANGIASSPAMTVAPMASSTKVTPSAKKITQRDREVLTVTVTIAGYDVPLGQVEVKDGSKVIGHSPLSAGKNGVITLRLKKLKLGKHKLTITYTGSASTLASTAKVTIKVVKAPKKK